MLGRACDAEASQAAGRQILSGTFRHGGCSAGHQQQSESVRFHCLFRHGGVHRFCLKIVWYRVSFSLHASVHAFDRRSYKRSFPCEPYFWSWGDCMRSPGGDDLLEQSLRLHLPWHACARHVMQEKSMVQVAVFVVHLESQFDLP